MTSQIDHPRWVFTRRILTGGHANFGPTKLNGKHARVRYVRGLRRCALATGDVSAILAMLFAAHQLGAPFNEVRKGTP